ncbi:hypothetical protein [Burkholderia stagnalis]|uniref:hypothetical protein n=1 Tax=Burkholderia stagnalis TaxID=1503054 RepID=UPI000ACEC603|nr:hypothetical protein [Burkholderia stagnalis]
MKFDVSGFESFLKAGRHAALPSNISKFFKAGHVAYIGRRLGLSAAHSRRGAAYPAARHDNIREKENNDASEQSEAVSWCGSLFADPGGV